MYEFTVVPSSLFAPVGSFYKTTDKSDGAAELRKLQSDGQPNEVVDTNTSISSGKVVINYETALVSAVDVQKFQIKNSMILQNASSTS